MKWLIAAQLINSFCLIMYSSYIAKLGHAQHKRTFCNCALMCQLLSRFWCIWWYNTSGFDTMMKTCQNSENWLELYLLSEQNNPFNYWPVSSSNTKTSLQLSPETILLLLFSFSAKAINIQSTDSMIDWGMGGQYRETRSLPESQRVTLKYIFAQRWKHIELQMVSFAIRALKMANYSPSWFLFDSFCLIFFRK